MIAIEIVTGILFLAIGLGFLGAAVWVVRRGSDSLMWPSTRGDVVSAEIRNTADDAISECYLPKITYRYNVDGTWYTGHEIGAKAFRGDQRDAEEFLSTIIRNGQVDVYFDPEMPAHCVLVRGYPISFVLCIAIAVAILLFAGLKLVLAC